MRFQTKRGQKHAAQDGDKNATFKPTSELSKIYEQCRVSPDKDTVVFRRIGECFSHTSFVLTYLLGVNNVRSGLFSRLLFFIQ